VTSKLKLVYLRSLSPIDLWDAIGDEVSDQDEMTKKALRSQIAKTLEVYKNPTKTPPKLSESIEELYRQKELALEKKAQQEAISAARKVKEYEELFQKAQKIINPPKPVKQRNPGVKTWNPGGKRKIDLSED
jgi:hypothetical protein